MFEQSNCKWCFFVLFLKIGNRKSNVKWELSVVGLSCLSVLFSQASFGMQSAELWLGGGLYLLER